MISLCLGFFDVLQQMNDLLLGKNIRKPEFFSRIQFDGENETGPKDVLVEKTGCNGKNYAFISTNTVFSFDKIKIGY
jgi:hypothetical protein